MDDGTIIYRFGFYKNVGIMIIWDMMMVSERDGFRPICCDSRAASPNHINQITVVNGSVAQTHSCIFLLQ